MAPPIEAAAEPAARPAFHRGPVVAHHPIAETDLDPDAVRIVRRLTRFDHSGYLVGGCVRDLLLDRKPKDFDIATSATPRQVKRLFSNCRIIGRRFRLAHVYFQSGKIIEVATFRARDVPDDAAPEEGGDLLIRDDNVFGTPEEDALRRDFTINALFYDVTQGNVLDHTDGLGDLRRRLVRTIGDPNVRFREDPIRILRAVKFAARLGFDIEEKTLRALRDHRGDIPKAAAPRILEEINRFCRSGAARASFDLLLDTEVFEVILPELAAAYPPESEARATLAALLDAVDARWRDQGCDIPAGEILARLLLAAGVHPSAPADGRAAIDAFLQPIALRLRVSRKDQEICRQVLLTLQRMVPVRNIRRGGRHAILKRPAAPDALRILAVLASLRGGEWAEASEVWSAAEPAPPSVVPHAPPATVEGAPPAERARTGRRRRRRRRGPAGEAATASPPAPAPRHPPRKPPARPAAQLPPVWDDNYFFAALPSVPPLDPAQDDGDRYGAGDVARQPAGTAEVAEPAPHVAAGEGSGPRRRRRRGRRGRGRGRGGQPGSGGESAPPSGGGADAGGD